LRDAEENGLWGFAPHPTKNPFAKRFFELPKPSKNAIL
jgi:hypothetical protein